MMLPKKLETELKCAICGDYFQSPRILNCGHSICEECGTTSIQKIVYKTKKPNSSIHSIPGISSFQNPPSNNNHNSSPSATTSITGSHESETDAFSESDSGIFLTNTSNSSLTSENAFASSMNQPGSTLKMSNKQETQHFQIKCPTCSAVSNIPSKLGTINYFPINLALESICLRYRQQNDPNAAANNNQYSKQQSCHLCDDSTENPIQQATVFCQQCEILYCQSCREKCHPMRGPLEKHSLVSVSDFHSLTKKKSIKCQQHPSEKIEYFCEHCSTHICRLCNENEHSRHLALTVSAHAKKCKVNLSKSLQRISEKAKSATAFIQNLRLVPEKIKTKQKQFLNLLDEQIDSLIEQLQSKKQELHKQIDKELEKKEKIVKDQINDGGLIISQTTSMLNLAVELIKDNNSLEFSLISNQMMSRATKIEKEFLRSLNELKPKCRKRFELKLNTESLQDAIKKLDFIEFKRPESPKFILDRCSVWDNLITVVWHPQGTIEVHKYLLEIDDGAGGPFKTAYCGPESICTIENLHFAANYRLRVRAMNEAGICPKGDVIKLTTSQVSKFRMLPSFGCLKNGVSISPDGLEIESMGSNSEDVVFMATTGFTKGIHYWEFKVDYYDGVGEPSFGVALENCAKNKRLGSDLFSWGMYTNTKRSWFLHNSEHSDRTDISLRVGSRIGVRLDLDRQRLSYFFNGEPHGPIAFSPISVTSSRSYNQLVNVPQTSGSNHSLSEYTSKSRLLYPAVSVSHGIRLVLVTGIQPPFDDSSSEDEENMDNINTPSLTRKIDVSHLLDDVLVSPDSSFKEIVL